MTAAKPRWAFVLSLLWMCDCSSNAGGIKTSDSSGSGGAVAAGNSAAGASGGSGGSAGSTQSGAGGSAHAGSGGAMASGSAGASAGGDQTAGSGGSASQAGDSGTASASADAGPSSGNADCTRDFMKGVVDQYFTALAAHDPASLPQASSLRFTENTKEGQLGEGLVWKTAGMVKFTRSALDTERCGTVTEAVIPNSGSDTIYGLRLQFEAQKITEVETIVVDPANGFFPTPDGIVNSSGDAWEELVPADQRAPREELEAAGKAYFASFGDSMIKVPYAMPCDRLENGFKTTQGDCSNFGGAVGLNQPEQRYPVTDLEAGITAGFILFAGADIDFHMFKVIDHEIRWINAVVGPAQTTQGWP